LGDPGAATSQVATMTKAFSLAAAFFICSCNSMRSVQVRPPISVPPGMVSGYGVEKISATPERARQAAYLRAMDDLLTRSGPVLVSKTVYDQTIAIDLKPVRHTLESTFRLRAAGMLQPSFERSGIDHGFVWVLLGITEDEIEAGWQQFVAWRAERVEQARKLFQEAKGPDRLEFLKASLSLLEDAGAADDPGMLYYQVKTALDNELARMNQLDRFQKDFRTLTDNGQLVAAEATLEQARQAGLERTVYEKNMMELSTRRAQAMQLIQAGDDLFREEHYKEARLRYQQARKLDQDNTLVANKIAMVERFEREAHARNVRETVGFVVPAATRTLTEYFEFKREEERRKREEELRKREEAERAAEEENRDRQTHRRHRRR
jgi:tetratricopeptide (TPR) repeat protein